MRVVQLVVPPFPFPVPVPRSEFQVQATRNEEPRTRNQNVERGTGNGERRITRPQTPVSAHRPAVLVVVLWSAIYSYRGLVGHYSLDTNAFDLSIFDYALWNLRQGGPGYVSFWGQSIFSQHFMPILVGLVPIHALFDSATVLLLLQVLATSGAGLVFYALQRQMGVERLVAVLLLATFLFARRTHGAVAGSFYPECFQALLTFAFVLMWQRGVRAYWLAAVVFLATKEDAPIYLASFALATFLSPALRDSRRGAATIALAIAWFVFAFSVAIPASRRADALPGTNVVMTGRFAASGED